MAKDQKAADQTAEGDDRTAARRKFLKQAGKVAVTTPAVTLLLAAGTKKTAIAEPPSFPC